MDVDKNSSILSNKSFFQNQDNQENLNVSKTSDKKNSSVSNDFRL